MTGTPITSRKITGTPITSRRMTGTPITSRRLAGTPVSSRMMDELYIFLRSYGHELYCGAAYTII